MPPDESAPDESDWMPVWLTLIRTHAKLWDRLEAQVRRDHGLTMARYDVLAHLDMADGGRLRLGELGASIVLSPSGLSKLLDRMDASGLIRREPDPDDARSTFATITPRGRALVRKARESHHELLRQLFGGALDDRDVADLGRVLEKVAAAVSPAKPA
jgi:DNA-binding MarR family transcriptional regulator